MIILFHLKNLDQSVGLGVYSCPAVLLTPSTPVDGRGLVQTSLCIPWCYRMHIVLKPKTLWGPAKYTKDLVKTDKPRSNCNDSPQWERYQQNMIQIRFRNDIMSMFNAYDSLII